MLNEEVTNEVELESFFTSAPEVEKAAHFTIYEFFEFE